MANKVKLNSEHASISSVSEELIDEECKRIADIINNCAKTINRLTEKSRYNEHTVSLVFIKRKLRNIDKRIDKTIDMVRMNNR